MVTLFTFLVCSVMAQAEKIGFGDKVGYPEQKLQARGIDRLEISGVKGHLKFTGRPGKTFRIKVRHSRNKASQDWSLSIDRRGNTYVFEVFSVAYGAQWRAHVRKELWPEFDLDIEGPAVPVTASWREGELEFNKWTANVDASQVKGRISVKDGGGNYALELGQSDVSVDGLGGNLRIKGESGLVRIVNLSGNLDLNWVAGAVELKKIVGDGQIQSSKSELRLSTCQGSWDIHLENGQALIENCAGKLKAQGESTAWTVRGSSWAESEIKSGAGAVNWIWKKGGAKVFLTSNQGEISSGKRPSFLDGEGRRVSEFTLGGKPFAQVFIKTQSGAIHFQQ